MAEIARGRREEVNVPWRSESILKSLGQIFGKRLPNHMLSGDYSAMTGSKSFGRPFRPHSWPDTSELGRLEAARRSREFDTWLPSNLIYIREAVDLIGTTFVEGWDCTEVNARPHLVAPRRPWQKREEEEPTRQVSIFDEAGHIQQVDLGAAESWWVEQEPQLLEAFGREREAHARWWVAVEMLRDELAQGRISGSVLTKNGDTHDIEHAAWRSSKAEQFFYLGIGEVVEFGVTSSYKFGGTVLLNKSALEKFIEREKSAKLKPNEQSAEASTQSKASSAPSFDNKKFPYLAFMIHAARAAPFEQLGRTPKKSIERWLRQNWPAELGEPTENKIFNMATLLRKPEDERGGKH